MVEKTAKDLKQERTTAKRCFTRQANYILRGADGTLQSELMEEFNKLSDCFRAGKDSNDEYRAGLEAEVKMEDEEAELSEQQEADLENTLGEAESKLAAIKDTVQTILWAKYGKYELETAIIAAEKANEAVGNLPVSSENLECYEEHLILSEKMTNGAKATMSLWERWVPPESRDEVNARLKNQGETLVNLRIRKPQFASARSLTTVGIGVIPP